MAEKNVRSFRTAVSGFNKADVVAYIEKMNADFRTETAKFNAASAEKDKKIAELTSLADSLQTSAGQAAEAEKRAELLEAENRELSGQAEKSAAVIASQSDIIDGLKSKLEEASHTEISASELEELTKRLAECEKKAQQYDDVSGQLGELIISARKSADDIISEAERKASDILGGAKSDAGAFREAISRAADEFSRAVNEIMSRSGKASDNG